MTLGFHLPWKILHGSWRELVSGHATQRCSSIKLHLQCWHYNYNTLIRRISWRLIKVESKIIYPCITMVRELNEHGHGLGTNWLGTKRLGTKRRGDETVGDETARGRNDYKTASFLPCFSNEKKTQISIPEIIIQSFDYNAYKIKHLNNRKGTNVFEKF